MNIINFKTIVGVISLFRLGEGCSHVAAILLKGRLECSKIRVYLCYFLTMQLECTKASLLLL